MSIDIVGANYLKIIDEKYNSDIHGVFEGDFEKEHFTSKYKWDDFQLHSYQAIKRGDNLLVVAPTSSGKTNVAKYATLFNLLQKNVKVIYTTPIKSLSNEKYEEMKELLKPYDIVPGLVTGDQKINIDSRFLIMTAEILSNALFTLKDRSDESKWSNISDPSNSTKHYELDRDFVKSIGCVIIDEIHFISDHARGHIWENTIILLHPSIQIIGLSATIDTPEEFASWIGKIKKKNITLVKKYDRPIPLEYAIFDGENLKTILTIDGNYNGDILQNSLKLLKDEEKKHEFNNTDKVNYLLNNFIKYSKENDLLQLCFIVFSKKNCEIFSKRVSINLMENSESADAVNAFDKKLGIYLKSYQTMPRYHQVKSLIKKGVCFHHAGLPVIMKEVIEKLFKEGHIKVLFATETVAIGVNMPIRTLVLTSVEKNTTMGIQYLNTAEFKQICGRAGRRGLDSKGLITFLPLYTLPSAIRIRNELLFGSMPKIESRLELTYHSYLKLLQSDVMAENDFFSNSFLSVQHSKMINGIEMEIIKIKKQIDEVKYNIDCHILRNSIGANIVKDIEQYIKTNDIVENMSHGFGYMGLNKNQIKNQKRLESVIKSNKILYDLIIDHHKVVKLLEKNMTEKKTYSFYKDARFSQIIEYLIASGYLTSDGKPTTYGKMIACINECNPFILAEIFTGNILQIMTPKQIVCIISVFTDKISKGNKDDKSINNVNVDKDVKDAIIYIENRIKNYVDLEKKMNIYSKDGYWDLSYDYIELVQLWADIDITKEDHGIILEKLNEVDEYEGSFIKNMLKINNITENLMSLCNLTQEFDCLPILQEIEKLIIKGMVNADSLHL